MEVLIEAVHESHDQNWELRKGEIEIWENMRIFILETKINCFTNSNPSFPHFIPHLESSYKDYCLFAFLELYQILCYHNLHDCLVLWV